MNKTIFMGLVIGIIAVVAIATAATSSVLAQGQVGWLSTSRPMHL